MMEFPVNFCFFFLFQLKFQYWIGTQRKSTPSKTPLFFSHHHHIGISYSFYYVPNKRYKCRFNTMMMMTWQHISIPIILPCLLLYSTSSYTPPCAVSLHYYYHHHHHRFWDNDRLRPFSTIVINVMEVFTRSICIFFCINFFSSSFSFI